MAIPIRYVVILVLALLLPIEVWAGIYFYVDKQGVSHYTNVPADRRYQPLQPEKINDVHRPPPLTGNGTTSRVFTPATAAHYDHHIRRAALSYSIDPLLLKAIIKTESNFNQYAVSQNGAQGLMQLMPKTAKDMRVKNPFNAAQNINGGARYLKSLLHDYQGDLVRTLAAYNAGPGRISKNGPLPKIPETIAYVKRVIHLYRLYQQRTSESRIGNISVHKLIKMN